MPTLILIAGPNGAGKTTFANEYLTGPHAGFTFVNADEIARELAQSSVAPATDVQAARLMLERLDELITAGRDIAIETTLASRTYASKIPMWKARGYSVTLIYIRLSDVEDAVERVRRRAEAGGHSIPEHVIRRRFDLSQRYFETLYKPIVNEWYVLDSLEGRLELKQAWDDGTSP